MHKRMEWQTIWIEAGLIQLSYEHTMAIDIISCNIFKMINISILNLQT